MAIFMYTISRVPPRSASTLIVLININLWKERGEGEKIAHTRERIMIYETSSLYDFQFSRLYGIPFAALILLIPLSCARCNFLRAQTKNLIGARVTRNFVLLARNLFAIK